MKNIFLLSLVLMGYGSIAQVGINTTGALPDASTMLDVTANNKGVLIPRMTTLQKNAIVSPKEGLLVYDTDVRQFSYCLNPIPSGTAVGNCNWVNFGNADVVAQSWASSGADIYNATGGNVGIGTPTPQTKLQVEGTSIIANNTLIDPDTHPDKVIAGRIADGTGWESIGIGGKNANPGQAWAIGSVHGDVSIAASDGTNDNSLQTGLILDRQRNLLLTPFGGNVAVGTNASKAKFEVTSPYTTTALFGSTSTGISLQQNWPTIGFNQYRDNANVQRYIGNGFAMGNFIDPTTGSMYWNSNPTGSAGSVTASETTIMNLTNDGKLGIGTSITPNSTLLTVKGTSPDGSAVFAGTTYNSHFHYSSTEDTYIRGGKANSHVILNDATGGNVGVGTIPLAKLHVKYGNSGIIPYGIAGFESNIDAFINLMCPQAYQSGVLFGSTLGSTRGGIIYTNNNGGSGESLALRTGGNINRLVIDKNGNVAIGNFLPTNKLDVNGTVRAKELIVETGWADYVFEEKYQMRSLDELESFIKTNKHLPNIPSASEIESKGLKVGETNKAMMEKIEELALYIIQLKKEIDLLKTKN
jgi:hypothetical protein